MKIIFKILLLLLIIQSCNLKRIDNKVTACPKGQMQQAWYTMGEVKEGPNFKKKYKADFLIVVDTNIKATNFISWHEKYNRERSISLDTTELYWYDDWENLTTSQKLQEVQLEKTANKKEADSLHLVNNKGQQLVWIYNNTNDTVSIQMQDWSFICVLQALSKNKQWRPIEYWRFSSCGNSYYYKDYLPKTGNAFITKISNTGNFKTKLRYKLLGADQFYYSTEFDGKIEYCQFFEDTTFHNTRNGYFEPHYKLDSLVYLAWQF